MTSRCTDHPAVSMTLRKSNLPLQMSLESTISLWVTSMEEQWQKCTLLLVVGLNCNSSLQKCIKHTYPYNLKSWTCQHWSIYHWPGCKMSLWECTRRLESRDSPKCCTSCKSQVNCPIDKAMVGLPCIIALLHFTQRSGIYEDWTSYDINIDSSYDSFSGTSVQIHLLLQLTILLIWQQSELTRDNKLTEHFGKFSETTFFRFKAGQNWWRQCVLATGCPTTWKRSYITWPTL